MSVADLSGAEEHHPELYEELRGLARRHFARQPPGHTLQPTALAHEAWLKLARHGSPDDRAHFLALASRAMRQVLVDHARAVAARPLEAEVRVTLSGLDTGATVSELDLLELEQALRELAGLSERQARLIELRFFGGLGEVEAAEVLGISRASASRQWRLARAWLARRMLGGEAAGPGEG